MKSTLVGVGLAAALSFATGTVFASSNIWTSVFGNIRPGIGFLDFGAPVRTLQGDLAQFGYHPGIADGYFGERTLASLHQFQRDHGLTETNALNQATYQTILRVGGWGGQTVTPPQQVLHLTATAYSPSYQENYPYGPVDYFGRPLVAGDVAVDPSVIPLGTKLWISGYHSALLPAGGFEAVARDTGSAIRGNRIDIFVNQLPSVVSTFGIQQVTVTVLGR